MHPFSIHLVKVAEDQSRHHSAAYRRMSLSRLIVDAEYVYARDYEIDLSYRRLKYKTYGVTSRRRLIYKLVS